MDDFDFGGAVSILIPVLIGCVFPIILSWRIGKAKGREGLGILLGILLSWLGVIIIACLSNLNEARAKDAQLQTALNRQNELLAQIASGNKQPPRVPDRLFRVAQNGQELGEYYEGEIRDMLTCGDLTKSDYFWYSGMNQWREISHLF